VLSTTRCVIAEMFLEGTSIFSLSQLFKYKSGDYSPHEQLEKIEDVDIRVSNEGRDTKLPPS
jgi:hypothetical protein